MHTFFYRRDSLPVFDRQDCLEKAPISHRGELRTTKARRQGSEAPERVIVGRKSGRRRPQVPRRESRQRICNRVRMQRLREKDDEIARVQSRVEVQVPLLDYKSAFPNIRIEHRIAREIRGRFRFKEGHRGRKAGQISTSVPKMCVSRKGW
jgi:hypothetical protein